MQNEELLAFSKRVQSQTQEIAALCLAGRTGQAGQKALALCTEAANVRAAIEMTAEADDPGRHDLSLLRIATEEG